jgi:hypothetical protein
MLAPFWPKQTHREMCLEPLLHPLASHDLPSFITAPGETDRMMVITGIFLIVIIVSVGALYFTLHSLPERMAHKSNHVQSGIIALLCLIALFTHQHIFWIIAILLAFIRVPDFETPLKSISESLERIAPVPGSALAAAGGAAALPFDPPPPATEWAEPPEPGAGARVEPCLSLCSAPP